MQPDLFFSLSFPLTNGIFGWSLSSAPIIRVGATRSRSASASERENRRAQPNAPQLFRAANLADRGWPAPLVDGASRPLAELLLLGFKGFSSIQSSIHPLILEKWQPSTRTLIRSSQASRAKRKFLRNYKKKTTLQLENSRIFVLTALSE